MNKRCGSSRREIYDKLTGLNILISGPKYIVTNCMGLEYTETSEFFFSHFYVKLFKKDGIYLSIYLSSIIIKVTYLSP